jgi:hypothetical protein
LEPQDVLPTLAEISVTVVGFTGVLVAFRPASAGTWSKDELVRIRAVLLIPGAVVVFSLLPFSLAGFSESAAVVWGLPLVAYGVFGFCFVARTLFEIIRGDFRLTSQPVGALLIAVSVVVNALLVLSGVGVLIPFSPGLLVFALSWNLVTTAATLVLMLVFWGRSPAV